MNDNRSVPTLRYHRFGGGYRREDVETALESLLATMRNVEGNLERLRARAAELERELRAAKLALESYHAREDQLEATLRRAEDVLARVDDALGDDAP
jgi:chromosome segregation ATPase